MEPLASGLRVPWDLAFLPDGSALVTERDTARIRKVAPDGTVTDVRTITEVPEMDGEGGLLGVAVSPSYEQDNLIYIYFTSEVDNRVARLRLDSQDPPEPILTGITRGQIHNGGRMRFGPDGMLYVTTGEADDRPSAQDREDLNGKILRITPEGKPAPGNPFPGSPVYSWGHRNVQGIAWDETGQLYASELGHHQLDEVNRIEPGANYGWPKIEGTGGEPEFTDPIVTWRPPEASPSGIAYHDGKIWVACLRGQRLYRVNTDGSSAEQLLTDEFGRLRLVTEAPDGSLWVLTNNRVGPDFDLILRVTP
ncbi:PQQ-dependent sugar dehydrogenase [Frankia sp. CNm7]|uniref:PQQ-dependent sugar dehydrogenase n=1 Tax=Frankia nepalensis TaxID=1836974 RepID=A0A937RKU1_9ACTN|nr:PQQ-dependent sugar dehydrogenase [Frankia nepalensis]MBL7511502.1 PQQ-dependent sugar dehydrogenase [Frankia nepalensis]MBL7520718.1 PQQ-dependent sugar dehydrogenase [Frankia nepalensis]MBL7630745.1 PQQ-dependent sugar dehydrogenase [Frankia nepalensis]